MTRSVLNLLIKVSNDTDRVKVKFSLEINLNDKKKLCRLYTQDSEFGVTIGAWLHLQQLYFLLVPGHSSCNFNFETCNLKFQVKDFQNKPLFLRHIKTRDSGQ